MSLMQPPPSRPASGCSQASGDRPDERESCAARERIHRLEVADAGAGIARVQHRVEGLVAAGRVLPAVTERPVDREHGAGLRDGRQAREESLDLRPMHDVQRVGGEDAVHLAHVPGRRGHVDRDRGAQVRRSFIEDALAQARHRVRQAPTAARRGPASRARNARRAGRCRCRSRARACSARMLPCRTSRIGSLLRSQASECGSIGGIVRH